MLVEVELENGNVAAGLFMHKLLSNAVGHSISAFAMCAAAHRTPCPTGSPHRLSASLHAIPG